MDELTTRNISALSEGLKEQRSQTSTLQKQITTYNNIIGQLQTQVQELQVKVGLLLAQVKGRGPTA